MAGTVRASSRCGVLQVEALLREEQRGGDGVRLNRDCLGERGLLSTPTCSENAGFHHSGQKAWQRKPMAFSDTAEL